ncbi:MAG: hypothetical protein PVJ42_02570 [bacterium]|jgi:hypothetical protein
MSRLSLLTVILLLSLFPWPAPSHAQSDEPIQIAAAGDRATELQKQSDYHQRVEKKREEREIEKQVAAIADTPTGGRILDDFVLILLAVSASAIFLISRRVRSGRRRRTRPRSLPLG